MADKSIAEFLEELFQSQVVVLLDKEIGEDERWDPSASPLILNDPAGTSMLAIFTSLERSVPGKSNPPILTHCPLISRGSLKASAMTLELPLYPGHALGAEINPGTTSQIRAFAQDQVET